MKRLFVALALGCATPQISVAQEAPRVSETDRGDLVLAITRGKQIFEYDQAAWHTTDALLEDVNDASKIGIQGWVVTKVTSGLNVTYFGKTDKGLIGLYSAVWTGSAVIERKRLEVGPDSVLQAEQLRLIAARDAASPVGLAVCEDKPFNTVVLPGEKPGDADLVYYLTPQLRAGIFPFGGHHRIAVKNGKEVERRSFTKSCMNLPTTGNKKGGKPSALVLTHLLDPIPTELHVFSVFSTKLPLYVMTQSNERIWVVEVPNGFARVRLLPPQKK